MTLLWRRLSIDGHFESIVILVMSASGVAGACCSLGLAVGEPKWKLVAAVALEARELGPKKSNMLEDPTEDRALVWDGRLSLGHRYHRATLPHACHPRSH